MTVRFAVVVTLLAGMTSWAVGQEAPTASGTREWKDATGRYTIHAEYGGLTDGMVHLKKADGSTVTLALEKLSSEDQQFVRSLTGNATSAGDPFQGGSRELKYDDGKAAGKQSFPGGGHTVRFEAPEGKWVLTAVKLHGSRYGLPMPPKEDFLIWVCDEQGAKQAELKIPYKTFKREAEKWVTMKVKPTPVPQKFLLSFYFNAEATKGIYVSYDGKPSEHSLTGVPDDAFHPFTKGNWMIRAIIEPAKDEAGKDDAGKAETAAPPAK